MDCDVAIVGGGPIGLTEACLLKTLNPKVNVTVIEKRSEITRSHGLAIRSDAVKRIHKLLDSAKLDQSVNQTDLKTLRDCFAKWGNHSSVKTSEIQKTLEERAAALGVKVLKGPDCEITKKNLSKLLKQEKEGLSEELQSVFKTAKVIIGADGAQSKVRKAVMGKDATNIVDENEYAYILELKYKVPKKQKDPSSKMLKFNNSIFERRVQQHVVRIIGKADGGNIPITDFIFVDKAVHQGFMQQNEKGEIKGSSGKPWSREELRERAKVDRVIKKYLKHIEKRVGDTKHAFKAKTEDPDDLKISTIPLKIYRSQKVVNVVDGKVVALVGDASSGLVLQRGLNKGLIEAAELAEATLKQLKEESLPAAIPEGFKNYQAQTEKMFANEKWWVEFKMKFLGLKKAYLTYIGSPIYRMIKGIFKGLKSLVIRSKKTRN